MKKTRLEKYQYHDEDGQYGIFALFTLGSWKARRDDTPHPFSPSSPLPPLFLSNYTARKTHGGGTTIIKKKTFSHSQNEIGETSDRLLQSALFAETEIRPAC